MRSGEHLLLAGRWSSGARQLIVLTRMPFLAQSGRYGVKGLYRTWRILACDTPGGEAVGIWYAKLLLSAVLAAAGLAGSCAPKASVAPVPTTLAATVRGLPAYGSAGMPVLCSWIFDLTAKQYGDECVVAKNEALQAELRSSIARIDAFVMANSSKPMTAVQLERSKEAVLRDNRVDGSACNAVNASIYSIFEQAGPETVRAGTDALLSAPREPVLQPCL